MHLAKLPEDAIYDWMKKTLGTSPLILELGSHHAEDSERFLRMFPKSTVIAWEPDPRNISVINAKKLQKTSNFTLVPAAVGAIDGTTTFFLSGGTPKAATGEDKNREWTYSSSVRRPKLHLEVNPSVEFVGETTVPIMRLDSYFAKTETRPIDFIWCDVQGNEADVIKGASKTLSRTRYFYTEYDDRELYEGQANLASLLRLLPYFRATRRYGNNVLLANSRLKRGR